MPLTMLKEGEQVEIQAVNGKKELKIFLKNLGLVSGSIVTIVSYMGGNMIVNIRDLKVAINKNMANKIIVAGIRHE